MEFQVSSEGKSRETRGQEERHISRGEDNVTSEAETEIRQSQAKEGWRSQRTKEVRVRLSHRANRRDVVLQEPNFEQ